MRSGSRWRSFGATNLRGRPGCPSPPNINEGPLSRTSTESQSQGNSQPVSIRVATYAMDTLQAPVCTYTVPCMGTARMKDRRKKIGSSPLFPSLPPRLSFIPPMRLSRHGRLPSVYFRWSPPSRGNSSRPLAATLSCHPRLGLGISCNKLCIIYIHEGKTRNPQPHHLRASRLSPKPDCCPHQTFPGVLPSQPLEPQRLDPGNTGI